MKAIIFDLDGVILDSEPMYDMCTINILKTQGIDAQSETFDPYRGTTSSEFWTQLKEKYSLSKSVDELIAEEESAMVEHFKNDSDLTPMSGLMDTLKWLKSKDIPMAVASSASHQRIDTILSRFGIDEEFEVQVSGDDVSAGKPNPEIFELTAEELGVEAKDCLVIEDSKNGVIAAKTIGMHCVGFTGSPSNRQDLSHADLTVKDFDQLQDWLSQTIQ